MSHRPTRRIRLTLALAAFGFAAAAAATSPDEERCRQCRIAWEHCVLVAETPNQAQACELRYADCVSTLDCPADP
ncbi:hypothetical protein K4L06_14510 [Lysobacter sp. BMK333-48F3]|uniref:hypothetical protein n=1 Tax=Lysobacter sp. BMK333-48F3 TaxID=2867962 RepID=UPI001C8B7D45|nr:hypothetical protein [Lysobacter sp. BMK333-48F3]MBX9402522.1 hypothetical protein [Lysobacter sp. BMK333-48F3]